MKEEIILEIIKIGVPATITGVIGLLSGYHIQKLKNRPKITTHGCRISGDSVYTYFDSTNKPSKPACPYLSKNGDCKYPVNPKINVLRRAILETNNGKCYIAMWSENKTK